MFETARNMLMKKKFKQMKFLLVFINQGLMHVFPVDFRHHDDDNDDDCFANMFETCFSMFQTVLMTMMTVE